MNNTTMNNTTNIENTVNTYKMGIKKDMKKFLFSSPTPSEENLKIILKKKNKPKKSRPGTTNLSRNIKILNQAKTQIKNDGKSKRENLTKYVNKLYIKKLFENDRSFNKESTTNNGSNNFNNISLNLTSYVSNPKTKFFNLKSNSLNRKPLKSTQISKQVSKNHSNLSELENSQPKTFLKNVIPKNLENKKLNHNVRNRFSLNIKTQNTSKEKGMSLKKNVKTNSLSKEKEKEKTINKRNTNIEYINNTKTLMIEPKYVNHKIIKTNNSIIQNIKIKKNNLIGIGNVNFSNIIRKNISKDKKPKLNIKNISINHTKQFKLNKAITTQIVKKKIIQHHQKNHLL